MFLEKQFEKSQFLGKPAWAPLFLNGIRMLQKFQHDVTDAGCDLTALCYRDSEPVVCMCLSREVRTH
jgi:hypothetical protein